MSLIHHGLEVALPADELFELHISVSALVLVRPQVLRVLLSTYLGLCLIRLIANVNLWILHFPHHFSVSSLSGLLGVWSDGKCRFIRLNVLFIPHGDGHRREVGSHGLSVQISPDDLRICEGCSGLLLLVVFLKTVLLLVHSL